MAKRTDNPGQARGQVVVDRRGFLALAGGASVAGLLSACRQTPAASTAASPPAAAAPAAAAPAAAAPAAVAGNAVANDAIVRGTLLCTDAIVGNDGATVHLISRIDLDDDVLRSRPFPIPFYAHGLAIDPRDAGRAVAFEKRGAGCCLVDLRTGAVQAMIEPRPGRQFYGHGTFNRDGAFLFCTETYVEDGSNRGVIAVRDSNSLRWISDLPSFGEAPHDVLLTPDRGQLVVTNGGGTEASGQVPNLAWIDLRSHANVRKLPFSSPRINAGHVALAADGAAAVVVSAARDGLTMGVPGVHGGVSFWHRDGANDGKQLRTAAGPIVDAMVGETLSVAIHDATGTVVATNPKANQVSLWDLASGALRTSTTQFLEPRGVAFSLDGSEMAISCGAQSELVLCKPGTLTPLPSRHLARIVQRRCSPACDRARRDQGQRPACGLRRVETPRPRARVCFRCSERSLVRSKPSPMWRQGAPT